MRLAGDGLGEKGLSGSRRPDKEDSLGDLAAELPVLGAVLQEVDYLADLLLCLIAACHVSEGGLHVLRAELLCLVLPDAEGIGEAPAASAPAGHLPCHENPDCDEENDREPVADGLQDLAALLGERAVDPDLGVDELVDEVAVRKGDYGGERRPVSPVS